MRNDTTRCARDQYIFFHIFQKIMINIQKRTVGDDDVGVYGAFNPYSAGVDIRRQNLTSDV